MEFDLGMLVAVKGGNFLEFAGRSGAFLMVQQMIDSKFNEYGLANSGTSLPNCDKQQLIAAKKTALRDLQNDNRIMAPKPMGNSPCQKDRGTVTDVIKVSGIKRPTPECTQSPPPSHQCPSSSGMNANLVYARRKSEQEFVKNNNCDDMNGNADCPQSRQFNHPEHVTPRQRSKIEGPKISCFSAFTPVPMTSFMTSSGGPSVPIPGKLLRKISVVEPNYPAVTSGIPRPGNSTGTNDQHWKERFLLLQTHLRNCDHSSLEEYGQMLRSLSSIGRSKHAFELERRAIQLSLEEVNEHDRVNGLNILGKSAPKNFVMPSTQQVRSDK